MSEVQVNGRRRPTQADVAAEAGVSQAAVSIVLSGSPTTRITEETRERVLTVAQQLGYSPNPAARSLAGGRTYLLGFHTFEAVFPTDQRDFYFPFLLGVEREATKSGYDVLLLSPRAGGASTAGASAASRLQMADGCVVLGRHVDRELLADLSRRQFPVVLIGRREIDGVDLAYVGVDYEAATRVLVRDVVGRGHRRLGYVGEPGGGEQSDDRVRGYLQAVEQLLGNDSGSVKHSAPLTDEQLNRWVAERHISAIFVEPGEDDRNVHALEAAADRLGYRIPEDISVVVVGDPEFSHTTRTDWQRFEIPRELIARRAVQLLVEILDGVQGSRQLLVAPSVVHGGTVADRGHS